MAIKKQEFYEGAALHQLVRCNELTRIEYDNPFFLLDNRFLVYFKYSTKGRSPWGFTFTKEEQELLELRAQKNRIVIGLVCGAGGVAAMSFSSYSRLAHRSNSSIHIACHRRHGEHYEVTGPDGAMNGKVSPSKWQRILQDQAENEA